MEKSETVKQKFPTAEAMVEQEVPEVSLNVYETLCRYLDGLNDIKDFATSNVELCKSFIIQSVKEDKISMTF